MPSGVNRLAGRVEAFLDDGREGTSKQRRLHLVGDAVELVANDFDGDGVKDVFLRSWLVPSVGGDDQGAVGDDSRTPAGLDKGRRIGLLDDRRAVDLEANRHRRPIVDLGRMNRPLSAVRMSRVPLCALSPSRRARRRRRRAGRRCCGGCCED